MNNKNYEDWLQLRFIHTSKLSLESEGYRVIIALVSIKPESTSGLLKEFIVWVSDEYLEGHGYKISTDGAEKLACSFLLDYLETNKEIPNENGVKITKESKEFGNPNTW